MTKKERKALMDAHDAYREQGLTSRQIHAIKAFLMAYGKYRKVCELEMGAEVDYAAYEVAHDIAGGVTDAFGISYPTPAELMWDILFSKTPPADVMGIADLARELKNASETAVSWVRWRALNGERLRAIFPAEYLEAA